MIQWFKCACLGICITLGSCSEYTVQKYFIEGTQSECCKTRIQVGAQYASFEISVLTDQAFLWERNYPSISAEYSSTLTETRNFKHMDVNLIVGDVRLTPTMEGVDAGYGDAFGSRAHIEIKPGECCNNLDQVLQYTPGPGDEYVKFGSSMYKKYKSDRLPKRMVLEYSVTTDRGTVHERKNLELVSKKEKAGNFIRVH